MGPNSASETGRKEDRNECQENRGDTDHRGCAGRWRAGNRDWSGPGQPRPTDTGPTRPARRRLAPGTTRADQAILPVAVTTGSLDRRAARDTVHVSSPR